MRNGVFQQGKYAILNEEEQVDYKGFVLENKSC